MVSATWTKFEDFILGALEKFTVRERHFREDFSRKLISEELKKLHDQTIATIEEMLVRERLYREDFTHRVNIEIAELKARQSRMRSCTRSTSSLSASYASAAPTEPL